MERIPVDVLLIEGTGPDARAHLRARHDDLDLSYTLTEPADRIAADTGHSVEQLPGKTVVALVDERGELAGFERA